MRRSVHVVAVACLLLVATRTLRAQTVTLTTVGATTQMPNPILADYTAGAVIDPTPITYSLRLNSGRATCTYTVLVQMKGTTVLGGTKPLSDLQWSTTGGYTSMTATYVTVATHTLTSTATTASGSITLRILLNWTDAATSYSGTTLGFQTSATASGTGC